jgi:arginyl-tRNA synthetase
LIFPDIAQKTFHLPHGMLRLREGKMSSRTGNIITTETLIDQVKEKVLEKIQGREFSEEEKENIAEMVAIGAIKYSILRQAIGGDIVFDFEKSISFEGDSGPYLQYTAVRAKSVLEKAPSSKLQALSSVPENWDSTEVERMLYRFPEIVERAGQEYAPHHLVTYLTELASAFNSFYGNNKIISEEDPTSSYKVALTESVYHVLKNGLHLLGIKVPERM